MTEGTRSDNSESSQAGVNIGDVGEIEKAIIVGGNVEYAHIGDKIYTRSPLEDLHNYLAAAVSRFTAAQMQRILKARAHAPIVQPYKFLDWFDLEDTSLFFGRDDAIEALYHSVTCNRLTILHARSGAGKTSLLNAGLAPRLIDEGRLPIFARAFLDPVLAVKRVLAPTSAGPWPELLHSLSLSNLLAAVCPHLLPHVRELILILDQFEEFFIFHPLREQRQRFIDDFAFTYADTSLPVRYVIAIRKDYYSDMADFEPHIPTILSHHYRLDIMTRSQAAQAITAPAGRLGKPVAYAPLLLDALLNDLASSGMELPHLQIICTKLYENSQIEGASTVDMAAYERLGRAPGILGAYLKDVIDRFPGRDGMLARIILMELVSSERTKYVLERASLVSLVKAKSPDLDDTVLANTLARLVNDRLLRRDDVAGEIVYELAHEYLITEIGQWIDPSELAAKQTKELLRSEVANWRIHHTLIPRDRLELIYKQRDLLNYADDAVCECLLLSAIQNDFAINDWIQWMSSISIQPLLAVMNSGNSHSASYMKARRCAALTLGLLQDRQAVEALIVGLNDSDSGVRRESATALSKLGDVRAVEPLVAVLVDSDGDVRYRAAEALSQLGDSAVDPLIVALKDERAMMRLEAAGALGLLGDARATEPLIAALRDRRVDVSVAVVVALVRLGDSRAIGPLNAILRDDTKTELHSVAVAALGLFGDAALEPLIGALSHEHERVRGGAAEALGQLGDARAVEPLTIALKDKNMVVGSKAAAALGRLGDPRAVEPLIAVFQGSGPSVRAEAVLALGQFGDAALEPLIRALTHDHERVRSGAAEALGQLGQSRAVLPLIIALEDRDALVRSAAARALGKSADPRSLAPLRSALEDGDSRVRTSALVGLGQLSDSLSSDSLIVAPDIGPLIAAFKDGDAGMRNEAVRVLGRLGDPATDLLISALKDRDFNVRRGAVEALGSMGVGAVEPLIMALKDTDLDVRRGATEALDRLGSVAVDALIAALKHGDPHIRRGAANVLERLGDPRAAGALDTALNYLDEWALV